MKKILFLFLIYNCFCFSKAFIKEEISINGADEEVFAVGSNIQLKGNFKNEVIIFGKNINGKSIRINGDFLSFGLENEIIGNIKNDLYFVGNRIFFEGEIGDSFTSIARNVSIENSLISGNLRIISNKISLKNVKVNQKSFFYGEKVKISGIFSDVVIHGKEIEIEKGSEIRGKLTYYSPAEISLEDIKIDGKVEYKKPPGEKLLERMTPFKRIKFLYSFLSLVFPYLLLLIFAPNLLKSTVNMAGKGFIKSFLIGLLLIFIFSLSILLSFIIIIGVPVGLIIISIFLSALYISRGFIFIYFARKIFFKYKDNNFLWLISIFLGILIFNLLSLNSTLKIILNLISIPSGFGALLIDRVKLLKRLRDEKLI